MVHDDGDEEDLEEYEMREVTITDWLTYSLTNYYSADLIGPCPFKNGGPITSNTISSINFMKLEINILILQISNSRLSVYLGGENAFQPNNKQEKQLKVSVYFFE